MVPWILFFTQNLYFYVIFILFSRVSLLVNLFSGVSILYFPCEKLQINSYLHFLAPVSILALSYSPLYHLYGTSRDTNFHVLTGYLRRFIVVNNGEKPGVSRCKQKGWSRMLWLQRLGLQRATGSSGGWGWGCGLVALSSWDRCSVLSLWVCQPTFSLSLGPSIETLCWPSADWHRYRNNVHLAALVFSVSSLCVNQSRTEPQSGPSIDCTQS